jgi:hypothetical protein
MRKWLWLLMLLLAYDCDAALRWRPIRLIVPPTSLPTNYIYRSLPFPVLGARALAFYCTAVDSAGWAQSIGIPVRVLFSNGADTSGAVRDTVSRYFLTSLPGNGSYGAAQVLNGQSSGQRLDVGGNFAMIETNVSSSNATGSPWSGCMYRFAMAEFTGGVTNRISNFSAMAYGLFDTEITSWPLSNSVTVTASVAADSTLTVTSGSLASVPIGAIAMGPAQFPGNSGGNLLTTNPAMCVRVTAKTSNTVCSIRPAISGAPHTGLTVTFVW